MFLLWMPVSHIIMHSNYKQHTTIAIAIATVLSQLKRHSYFVYLCVQSLQPIVDELNWTSSLHNAVLMVANVVLSKECKLAN